MFLFQRQRGCHCPRDGIECQVARLLNLQQLTNGTDWKCGKTR